MERFIGFCGVLGGREVLSVKAICEGCEKELVLNSQTVIKRTEQCLEDKEILQIVSYECKYCGRIHLVQLDDSETNLMLRDVTKLMYKAAKKRQSGGDLSKKEIAKLTKIRKDLADKRLLLKEKYQGKHYLDKDGQEKVFEFSM